MWTLLRHDTTTVRCGGCWGYRSGTDDRRSPLTLAVTRRHSAARQADDRGASAGQTQFTSYRRPSPDGQVSGMAGGVTSRRPPGGRLPHDDPGGQSFATSAGGCPGPPRGSALPGRRDATSLSAVWRSKPGANDSRAPVTDRDPMTGRRRSTGTRRHRTSVADQVRPRSGRRAP